MPSTSSPICTMSAPTARPTWRISNGRVGSKNVMCQASLFRYVSWVPTPSGLAGIGLDPIAVGIDHEGGVVGIAVVRADPRLAVILAAGFERARVEGVDGLAARRVEANVQAGLRIRGN